MAFEIPPFAQALDDFREFIQSQGQISELIWIFRDDVVEQRPRIYVKIPLQDDSSAVELLYTNGIERELGIHFNVFCYLDGRPCCYIWLPEDQQDANYRMLSGLKMSMPSEPSLRVATPVRNNIWWFWLKLRNHLKRGYKWTDDIPVRNE